MGQLEANAIDLGGTLTEWLFRWLILSIVLKFCILLLGKSEWAQLNGGDWLILISAASGIGIPFLMGSLGVISLILCIVLFVLAARVLTNWLANSMD